MLHDWTRANPELADGILFALLGLVTLPVRKVCGFISQCWVGHVAAERFAHRVRQARANDEYVIGDKGLWL